MATYNHTTKQTTFTAEELAALAHRYEDPENAIQQWLDYGMKPLMLSVDGDALEFARENKIAVDFGVPGSAVSSMYQHPAYETEAIKAGKRRGGGK